MPSTLRGAPLSSDRIHNRLAADASVATNAIVRPSGDTPTSGAVGSRPGSGLAAKVVSAGGGIRNSIGAGGAGRRFRAAIHAPAAPVSASTPSPAPIGHFDRARRSGDGCGDRLSRRGHLGSERQAAEREREIARRLETGGRVLLHAPAGDEPERRWNRSRRFVGDGRRRVFQDRADGVGRRGSGERTAAGEHLEDDAAQREDVDAVIDGLAARLLGRHVAERSEHDVRQGAGEGHVGERLTGLSTTG